MTPFLERFRLNNVRFGRVREKALIDDGLVTNSRIIDAFARLYMCRLHYVRRISVRMSGEKK